MRVEDAEVEVTVDSDRTRIEFDAPTDLLIGARSQHDRPAATVTTTEQPADVRPRSKPRVGAHGPRPRRSYPTRRGHPPALDIGIRWTSQRNRQSGYAVSRSNSRPISRLSSSPRRFRRLGASLVPARATARRPTRDLRLARYRTRLDSEVGRRSSVSSSSLCTALRGHRSTSTSERYRALRRPRLPVAVPATTGGAGRHLSADRRRRY